jgi:hypothetical protein
MSMLSFPTGALSLSMFSLPNQSPKAPSILMDAGAVETYEWTLS